MRSAPKSGILEEYLLSIAESRSVEYLTESNSDDRSDYVGQIFSPACSCNPENTGIRAQKSPISNTAFLDRNRNYNKKPWNDAMCTKYRIVGLLFLQSMRLASDGSVGAYMGTRGAGRPLRMDD
jgi:hypothetical protein